jgi:hypothetical protein
MSEVNHDFTGRRPRHAFSEGHAAEAWLERDEHGVAAELIDFSRHGVGLLTGDAAETHDRVTVHIRHANSGLDLSLKGTVRWRRREGEGRWFIGCEFDAPVPLETLGELFLHEVLEANQIVRS